MSHGDAGHLGFSQKQRIDARFAQKGAVSMPYRSGHICLVTNEHGQCRLMTLRPARRKSTVPAGAIIA